MLAGISCWYSILIFLMWCPLSSFLPFLTAFGQLFRKKKITCTLKEILSIQHMAFIDLRKFFREACFRLVVSLLRGWF